MEQAAQEVPQEQAGEQTAPEQTPVVEETPKAPDPIERSWAAVTAREKKFLEQRKAFETEKTQFEQSRGSPAQPQTRDGWIDPGKFKSDPLKALEDHGFNLDDIQNRVLNDGAASPQELIKRESSTTRSRMDETKKEIADLKQELELQKNQRMVSKYQNEIQSELNDERFDLLRAYPQAENMVFNLASSYADQHGEILTARDAADRIQSELKEQLTVLAENPAVRKALGLAEVTQEQSATEVSKVPSGSGQTLKNNMAASPAPPAADAGTPGSEYDSLLRIRDRLRANLSE
jgi:hypothetical protein